MKNSQRLEIRLPPELLQRIDEWREKQPAWTGLSAAVRCLIKRGLTQNLDLPPNSA